MEIIDAGFRHISPEDKLLIGSLRQEAGLLQKPIQHARIALYVLMGATIVGMAMGFSRHDIWDILLEGSVLVIIFCGAAWYVDSHPKIALIAGLSGYLLQLSVYAFLTPDTIFRGLILKAAIIYYLIKGIGAAFQLEKIRKRLREFGEELSVSL